MLTFGHPSPCTLMSNEMLQHNMNNLAATKRKLHNHNPISPHTQHESLGESLSGWLSSAHRMSDPATVLARRASWWSCQRAACLEWVSRWASCPPVAWRRAEIWGLRVQLSVRAGGEGGDRSAGVESDTACVRIQSAPPEPSPADSPRGLGPSVHMHL